MAISAAEILRVRRMTNELDDDPSGGSVYTDELITAMAENHAFVQSKWPDEDETVYDLHAIAADIWEEKAAALSPDVASGNADEFGDTTDKFVDSSYEHALKQVEYHHAHRIPISRKPVKWPRETELDMEL
jgi:hypothetical protein